MDAANIKIAANTAAVTSDAFDLFGESKIIAFELEGDEYAKLLEEEPGGTYIPVIDKAGVGILVTAQQPSVIITGYGSYKLYKTATTNAVAVAVLS